MVDSPFEQLDQVETLQLPRRSEPASEHLRAPRARVHAETHTQKPHGWTDGWTDGRTLAYTHERQLDDKELLTSTKMRCLKYARSSLAPIRTSSRRLFLTSPQCVSLPLGWQREGERPSSTLFSTSLAHEHLGTLRPCLALRAHPGRCADQIGPGLVEQSARSSECGGRRSGFAGRRDSGGKDEYEAASEALEESEPSEAWC